MSVVGSGATLSEEVEEACRELGRRAVEAGFRVATGGLAGVMEAVSRGAREAASYREGDVIGVLKSYEAESANAAVDIAIPTGIGIARNVILVSMADAVVVVGGGAGTLSEIALAWQLGKPVIALATTGGWAARLAGEAIDATREDVVVRAETAEQAVAAALSR